MAHGVVKELSPTGYAVTSTPVDLLAWTDLSAFNGGQLHFFLINQSSAPITFNLYTAENVSYPDEKYQVTVPATSQRTVPVDHVRRNYRVTAQTATTATANLRIVVSAR